MSRALRCLLPVACLLSIACRHGESHAPVDSATAATVSRMRQDSINRAQPGYVIDSILPPDEEMRRFRAAFPGEPARRLVGGSTSRDALVRRFVVALSASDTGELRAMAVHGREFADLYYPDSPYSRAPYRQPPSFTWRMIQDPSTAGLSRLLKRLGGRPMSLTGLRCDPMPLHEGRTTRYAGCLVRVVDETGHEATRRYFGSIIERDGQFKFLSYTNDF